MENNTKITREQATESIIEYFKQNEDIFNECIEELDCYNGYLGDDRYYEMDELSELLNGFDTMEIIYKCFYGYCEDEYTTDERGEKHYCAFNPNCEYFTFNGYGNLVSAWSKDYTGYIDGYAVKSMLDNRNEIDAIDEDAELADLFDALEACED